MIPSIIGQSAQRKIWQDIREQARRRLSIALTIGVLYLFASIAVGMYLLWIIHEVGQDAIYLDGWDTKEIPTDWVMVVFWGYAATGGIGLLAYPLLMLFINEGLPGFVWWLCSSVPWIGSTGRMVALADLCQSMHESTLDQQTYSDAMEKAAAQLHAPIMKDWAGRSAVHLRAGHSIADVLAIAPINDLPLRAIGVAVRENLTAEETQRVWRHAASESHRLVQSRLSRTIQVLSVFVLLISIALAAFAMLSSALFLRLMLQGLT